MCDMTHLYSSYLIQASRYMTCLIHMCDVTYLYVRGSRPMHVMMLMILIAFTMWNSPKLYFKSREHAVLPQSQYAATHCGCNMLKKTVSHFTLSLQHAEMHRACNTLNKKHVVTYRNIWQRSTEYACKYFGSVENLLRVS